MDSKIIGYRINAALALENKKQKELAKELGVTDNTISYFCSGKRTPNISQIVKIAKYLNVSTDYLLGIERGSTPEKTALISALGLSEDCIGIIEKASGTEEAQKIEYLLRNKDKIFELIEGWKK
jgi:transcriptional regulator with XRE-family HTH domain